MKILVLNFLIFLFNQFQFIHRGDNYQKIKSSAALGVTLSPLGLIFDDLHIWFFSVSLLLFLVGMALFFDLLFGIIVHLWFFNDFSGLTMLKKFLIKLVLTYSGVAIFGLFEILFRKYELEIGNYIKLSLYIAIMLYPILSVLGNMSVISGGKFPSKNFIKKIESVQKNLKVEEYFNLNKK